MIILKSLSGQGHYTSRCQYSTFNVRRGPGSYTWSLCLSWSASVMNIVISSSLLLLTQCQGLHAGSIDPGLKQNNMYTKNIIIFYKILSRRQWANRKSTITRAIAYSDPYHYHWVTQPHHHTTASTTAITTISTRTTAAATTTTITHVTE
jgi:hypothetical protein